MLMAIVLFEKSFLHIVAITFTALVLTELLMVSAATVHTQCTTAARLEFCIEFRLHLRFTPGIG